MNDENQGWSLFLMLNFCAFLRKGCMKIDMIKVANVGNSKQDS